MKTTVWLSMIIALRFLGLFIVLPLLSIYAAGQVEATPFLVGLAVGSYALTQMFFQYPLGRLSDRIGRKKIIIFGLVIFAIGSVICAVSDNIYLLIIGRLLQGAGAISSTITAMISDFTMESERSKAMAMMGGAIAMSFVVSMVAGPLIGGYFGIEILFIITAVLALLAVGIMLLRVPESDAATHIYEFESRLGDILKNRELLRMNITMFFHSSMMTIAFLIIPLTLVHNYHWDTSDLWKVYLPAITLGFLFMGLAAVMGEKHNKIKQVFTVSVVLFGVSFLLFGVAATDTFFVLAVLLFFIGFMMLEPLLQSTTTKIARIHERGAALGVFNTVQFFGVFVGGLMGGYLLQHFSLALLGYLFAALSVVWLIWVIGMKNPIKGGFVYLEMATVKEGYRQALKGSQLVMDFYVNTTENTLVIKYNPAIGDEESVHALLDVR